jgi:beta-lactamase superfamily II metal-dependent hydrolase
MLFYAQQVDIDKTTRRHDVVLDFATLDDHLLLEKKLFNEAAGIARENPASMLRFTYVPSGAQGLKEGSWYDFDLSAFTGAEYQPLDQDAEGAAFLRANLIGSPNVKNFAPFLTSPRVASTPSTNLDLGATLSPNDTVQLTVVDCGHGNWNEISTISGRVLYDVGASRRFTRKQVRDLIDERSIGAETRPITVVISHWDIDHYHALLEFQSSELAKLQVVFTPSQVPDTATYKRVAKRLSDHQVRLAAVAPAPRSGTTREITLERHWQNGIFTVFRATPGRSRNQTGIVLGVQGQREVALLTGDHHYNKVLVAASKIPSYRGRPCILVAPHHGGLAGEPLARDWLAFFSSLTTPISCGLNSHGHPIVSIETELKKMQAGRPPNRTDISGTWTRAL